MDIPMDQFPNIPVELLRALEERFPEKAPSKTETSDDLRWRGGEVSVIRFLKSKFEEQNDNLLDRTIT
jgi:hypothetical protein